MFKDYKTTTDGLFYTTVLDLKQQKEIAITFIP